jgi:endonuclease/exonuclease/phosphatase family metal-dependent hydrolase
MTRVLSYNILIGGTKRVDLLTKIIKSKQPDIVGLLEAIDPEVVKTLAENLGMQYKLSGRAQDDEGWQAAILSHLPIIEARTHINKVLIKQPLLELRLQEANGHELTVFVTHLTADFNKAWIANHTRSCEVQELLRIMSSKRGPHLLMGDFNSIAPGERLNGSSFLSYVTNPNLYYRLQPGTFIGPPDLNFVLPSPLRIFKPFLEFISRSEPFSRLLDKFDALYAPRGGIGYLQRAGYVDCFRKMNLFEPGFTWPAPSPAGRVDFIFACPELARRLRVSGVVTAGEGVSAEDASDHLPIFAEFIDVF